MDWKKTGAVVFISWMGLTASTDALVHMFGVDLNTETFVMERTATGSTSTAYDGQETRVQNTVLGDVYAARSERRGAITDTSSRSLI